MASKSFFERLRKRSFGSLIRQFFSLFRLGSIENLTAVNWFNPFATIWLNFRTLKFNQAVFLPIAVYGRPRIYSLSGRIIINGPIHTGMISFNQSRLGSPCLQSIQSEIHLLGTIIFNGNGIIGTGNRIFVERDALLTIGKAFKITDMVNIGCMEKISIGDYARVVHRCQVFDSNYHFIANLRDMNIPDKTAPIIIGKGCWICNNSTINKGTILPDYTIVCSNSVVNNKTNNIPEGSTIGGSPAKLLFSGVRRVNNRDVERMVIDYYKSSHSEPFKIENLNIDNLTESE